MKEGRSDEKRSVQRVLPPLSVFEDVRIHSRRYRGGGVGDSCLLTSGRGRTPPHIKRGGNNGERDVEVSPPQSVTVSAGPRPNGRSAFGLM